MLRRDEARQLVAIYDVLAVALDCSRNCAGQVFRRLPLGPDIRQRVTRHRFPGPIKAPTPAAPPQDIVRMLEMLEKARDGSGSKGRPARRVCARAKESLLSALTKPEAADLRERLVMLARTARVDQLRRALDAIEGAPDPEPRRAERDRRLDVDEFVERNFVADPAGYVPMDVFENLMRHDEIANGLKHTRLSETLLRAIRFKYDLRVTRDRLRWNGAYRWGQWIKGLAPRDAELAMERADKAAKFVRREEAARWSLV